MHEKTNEEVINIAQFLESDAAFDATDGAKLGAHLMGLMHGGRKVVMDFSGIHIFGAHFLQEVLRPVYVEYGPDRAKSLLRPINMTENDSEIFDRVDARITSYAKSIA